MNRKRKRGWHMDQKNSALAAAKRSKDTCCDIVNWRAGAHPQGDVEARIALGCWTVVYARGTPEAETCTVKNLRHAHLWKHFRVVERMIRNCISTPLGDPYSYTSKVDIPDLPSAAQVLLQACLFLTLREDWADSLETSFAWPFPPQPAPDACCTGQSVASFVQRTQQPCDVCFDATTTRTVHSDEWGCALHPYHIMASCTECANKEQQGHFLCANCADDMITSDYGDSLRAKRCKDNPLHGAIVLETSDPTGSPAESIERIMSLTVHAVSDTNANRRTFATQSQEEARKCCQAWETRFRHNAVRLVARELFAGAPKDAIAPQDPCTHNAQQTKKRIVAGRVCAGVARAPLLHDCPNCKRMMAPKRSAALSPCQQGSTRFVSSSVEQLDVAQLEWALARWGKDAARKHLGGTVVPHLAELEARMPNLLNAAVECGMRRLPLTHTDCTDLFCPLRLHDWGVKLQWWTMRVLGCADTSRLLVLLKLIEPIPFNSALTLAVRVLVVGMRTEEAFAGANNAGLLSLQRPSEADRAHPCSVREMRDGIQKLADRANSYWQAESSTPTLAMGLFASFRSRARNLVRAMDAHALAQGAQCGGSFYRRQALQRLGAVLSELRALCFGKGHPLVATVVAHLPVLAKLFFDGKLWTSTQLGPSRCSTWTHVAATFHVRNCGAELARSFYRGVVADCPHRMHTWRMFNRIYPVSFWMQWKKSIAKQPDGWTGAERVRASEFERHETASDIGTLGQTDWFFSRPVNPAAILGVVRGHMLYRLAAKPVEVRPRKPNPAFLRVCFDAPTGSTVLLLHWACARPRRGAGKVDVRTTRATAGGVQNGYNLDAGLFETRTDTDGCAHSLCAITVISEGSAKLVKAVLNWEDRGAMRLEDFMCVQPGQVTVVFTSRGARRLFTLADARIDQEVLARATIDYQPAELELINDIVANAF